jgi:hypothetical protein
MSKRQIVSIVQLCSLASLVSITLSAKMARGDDCLAGPGLATPGSHWYFRTERTTQKRCWHLSDARQAPNGPASEKTPPTLETLMAASSEPAATAKNGATEKDVRTLYTQFLEWKRRTGQ